jgi:hypothetical protein
MATIYETELVTNGDLRYRVQVRQRSDGAIQQRHLFYANHDLEDMNERPTCTPWLNTGRKTVGDLLARMSPANHCLDEWGEAIAALEAIARGHNDARTRAIDALHRIRAQTPEGF